MRQRGRGSRFGWRAATCLPRRTTGEHATTAGGEMSPLIVLAVFAAAVALVAVVGVRLGMLLAPRIDRLTDRSEEEPGGDDD
jgi:hypothetical protein